MPAAMRHLWDKISNSGTSFARTERDRKDIILLNRAWLILVVIQSASLVSHLVHGMHRSAWMTAVYIAGLFLVKALLRIGKIDQAKIAAIAVINFNTCLMAVFFGVQSNVIDFLLLTAMLPLYFFEIQKRKLIFWGVSLSIFPFAVYHYFAPYIAGYGLPVDQQLAMLQSTNWLKVFCLAALIYLIYNKNLNYEREVVEKEEALNGQKKLYECILEQIPIDIVTFDNQLRYSYINSAAIKDPEMRQWLMGKTNVEYFTERNLDVQIAKERDSALHNALEKGAPVEFEESFVDRHGVMRHSVKGTAPIYSEDKHELLCLIGYSLDITDIKEAEEKLKEYAKELERKNEDLHHFVNATSHDLKTPLRNIASYLQILERKNREKLDDDSRAMIDYTVKSVKHLNQLITDIYQYSVADRHDKPAELTNLNEVLEKMLLEMEGVITEKNATIQFTRLPVIKALPSHLGLVFANLLGNALKYNQAEHAYVKVDCKITDDEYVFSVTDNGIGIPKQYQKQIFEIFRRLHTSEQYDGTGVGLAICTKIVENYGGKLWVQSEEAQGSTFYFSLSRNQVDPERSRNIGLVKKIQLARA